ncbi:MAG: peptidoglycan recognition protein family protein [Allosphingosinicella sp.]
MAFSLSWLPEVLENAGLKVAEQPGWLTRGRGDIGTVRGVVCHHTAGPASGNMPSLGIVTNGRPGLPGPLSQLCLGRDGTYFVVAAGRANHAGPGNWRGVTTGNSSFIGIEAENRGRPGDAWPEVQLDAYRRGVAAILSKIGVGANMCCGHKEYALPPGRKPDPLFDMDDFRSDVAAIMAGTGPVRPLIPAVGPGSRPTLRRGDRGDAVKRVQEKVGVGADGIFGPNTEAAVRRFQTAQGLVPDGIVGPKTWDAIDAP